MLFQQFLPAIRRILSEFIFQAQHDVATLPCDVSLIIVHVSG